MPSIVHIRRRTKDKKITAEEFVKIWQTSKAMEEVMKVGEE